MEIDNKPDIPKIVFAGIPILLIWWAVVFIALAIISRDVHISKYGSLSIFVLSIPIYGFVAIKYSSQLGATIDFKEELKQRNKGLRRHVTNFDLWFAGILIVAIPLYFFIGIYVFGISEDRLTRFVKWLFLVAILIELSLRKKLGKK
jgi:hypothetical protein